jgi:hypothetical protein
MVYHHLASTSPGSHPIKIKLHAVLQHVHVVQGLEDVGFHGDYLGGLPCNPQEHLASSLPLMRHTQTGVGPETHVCSKPSEMSARWILNPPAGSVMSHTACWYAFGPGFVSRLLALPTPDYFLPSSL